MAQFESRQLAVRRTLTNATSPAPNGSLGLTHWTGEPVTPTTFWNPHIRTTATLKAGGWPAEFRELEIRVADNRAFMAMKQQQAAQWTQLGVSAPTRAIPGVFVPTSPTNNYGGPSSL
jgi:hypothetical protein